MAVGASISTLSAILKQFYLPPVVEQLNNEVLLFSRLESRDQELRGAQAYVPLHTNRSGGIGPAAENIALPAAGSQGYDNAVYDIKPQYGRVRVTGLAMEKTEKESGAFLKALEGEVDGIRADLKRDMARQTYGDGTGQIAQCGVTSASTTVVLNATSGKEAIRKGHLYIGMNVDIGTAGDARAITTNASISDVNLGAATITISASVTTTASHFVYRSGAGAATTGGVIPAGEISGLKALVSDAANTVGGINEASAGKGFWAPIRDTTTSTLSSDALVQNMNQVRIAGGELSVMLGSFGLQRKLFGLLQSQVRYVEPTTIRGGFKVLEFNGHDFIADRDAPFGHLYLLDERFIKVFRNRDWHWLDKDGNILKWVTGFDAWEAVLACYLNMGVTRRNTQLVMTNLAGDDPNGF
jgi:hypothetical protein